MNAARGLEARAPRQQHAQVMVANMKATSFHASAGKSRLPSECDSPQPSNGITGGQEIRRSGDQKTKSKDKILLSF
jgi:hypothetical protein